MLRKPSGVPKRIFATCRYAKKHSIGMGAASSDLQLVISADLWDDGLSFTALTTSTEAIQHSPEALLNNANRPLLIPFLQLLYRRGALMDERRRREIARYLVPSVHHDHLPWLWRDSAGSSPTVVIRGDVSALRSLLPSTWRAAIDHGGAAEPSERLHYWHQVFFAIASNPAFAEPSAFDQAHRELLAIVRDYYTDVLRLQELLPPLADDVTVTRMPPVLVRKLRKLYSEQCRLLQYAEFFRAAVEGEELVMPTCGTALVNDVDVFEYYLTIPGRRESGMGRDERWASTLEYAAFAFRKLFRQLNWKVTDISALMTRPAGILMNACVFARNDNAEGDRYREAILTMMNVFRSFCKEGGNSGGAGASSACDSAAVAACSLLRVLRDAGVSSMLAKCKALHFGPMRGLLDVCTVAAVLELLLCEEAIAEARDNRRSFIWNELEVLLSHRKIVGDEMYVAASGHPHHRRAAHYGIVNLGARIASALFDVVRSASALGKYAGELVKWGLLIGRPLRMTICDAPLTHLTSFLPWLSLNQLECEAEGLKAGMKAASSWTCGCECVNPIQLGAVSCAACVSRHLVEHAWTCPHCSWVSSSGDYIDTCFACSHPHPRGLSVEHDNRVLCVKTHGGAATPCLWACDYCHSYSQLGVSRNNSKVQTCMDCGAGDTGWAASFFEWKCGCGALNSPLRRWCSVCSFGKADASCVCVYCREWWRLRLRRLGLRDECPACAAPHPRDVAAFERRLWRCPFCHSLTPDSARSCQNCQRPMGMLSQFLPLLPDVPWHCHACGGRHNHRDDEGVLLQTKPERNCSDVCMHCGVHRLDPVLFNRHEAWTCGVCGDVAVHGWCCRRCYALHPAVPSTEVHVWQCVVCRSVNNSWDGYCQRHGCGTRRSADTITLQYAPWCCVCCGKFSRTSQVPQCEHCEAVRSEDRMEVAGAADERHGRRLADVEAQLLSASPSAAGDFLCDELLELMSRRTAAGDWSCCISDSVQLSIPLL
ncbi:hypothetical protein, conserved [Trypanosoma brucei gambiense DAL972]|uniref:RanBP2-type domain-containing protein n=2 Tax=Trypanosoma brucei TaxID=5691 RepID=D0A4K4_TRYB9|nr:hypothetical protein, conserved [Trypanosoma brucei gambiense DAL972]CBH16198.1 hypothetical protein, conserved [Trypanosoma brucei gambiense DAL972]|eukprot:XP_011778462.1 hypothetical protein, conserved [Trypanosoma brucei gambiense DAL972]